MKKSITIALLIFLLLLPGILHADCLGKCGDANEDGNVAVSDVIFILNYIFAGGNPPGPVKACGDANGDCNVNVSDAVYLIAYIFLGGDPPAECCAGGWEGQGGDCCPF